MEEQVKILKKYFELENKLYEKKINFIQMLNELEKNTTIENLKKIYIDYRENSRLEEDDVFEIDLNSKKNYFHQLWQKD